MSDIYSVFTEDFTLWLSEETLRDQAHATILASIEQHIRSQFIAASAVSPAPYTVVGQGGSMYPQEQQYSRYGWPVNKPTLMSRPDGDIALDAIADNVMSPTPLKIKVKILSGGDNYSSRVIDSATGRAIDGVTKVVVTIDARSGYPTAVLTVFNPEVLLENVEAEVDIQGESDEPL